MYPVPFVSPVTVAETFALFVFDVNCVQPTPPLLECLIAYPVGAAGT